MTTPTTSAASAASRPITIINPSRSSNPNDRQNIATTGGRLLKGSGNMMTSASPKMATPIRFGIGNKVNTFHRGLTKRSSRSIHGMTLLPKVETVETSIRRLRMKPGSTSE